MVTSYLKNKAHIFGIWSYGIYEIYFQIIEQCIVFSLVQLSIFFFVCLSYTVTKTYASSELLDFETRSTS